MERRNKPAERYDTGKRFSPADGYYTWREGFTLDEIAFMMGLPRQRVINYLYRGLKKLREHSDILRDYL